MFQLGYHQRELKSPIGISLFLSLYTSCHLGGSLAFIKPIFLLLSSLHCKKIST